MCIIPPSQNQKKFRWSLVAFKGTIRKNPFRGEHYHEKEIWSIKSTKIFWLCGVMHTADSRSRIFRTLCSNISAKSKPNSQILYPVYHGFESLKKIEVENLLTHSIVYNFNDVYWSLKFCVLILKLTTWSSVAYNAAFCFFKWKKGQGRNLCSRGPEIYIIDYQFLNNFFRPERFFTSKVKHKSFTR